MLNDAHRKSQRVVEHAHPLRIALGEVVVHGDEVNAFPFECIQIDRQGGHEGFPFAGLHFSNAASMENHAADQLHIEMAHVQLAAGHFTTDREGLRQDVVQGLPGLKALLELLGLVREGLIGERSQAGFQAIDPLHNRAECLDFTIVFAAEDLVK